MEMTGSTGRKRTKSENVRKNIIFPFYGKITLDTLCPEEHFVRLLQSLVRLGSNPLFPKSFSRIR
jgi:hypothetical protein